MFSQQFFVGFPFFFFFLVKASSFRGLRSHKKFAGALALCSEECSLTCGSVPLVPQAMPLVPLGRQPHGGGKGARGSPCTCPVTCCCPDALSKTPPPRLLQVLCQAPKRAALSSTSTDGRLKDLFRAISAAHLPTMGLLRAPLLCSAPSPPGLGTRARRVLRYGCTERAPHCCSNCLRALAPRAASWWNH